MAAENNINSSGSELSEKDKKFRDFALNGNLWKVIFYVCIPPVSYTHLTLPTIA